MSAVGGLIARAVSALGGAPAAGAVVVAGLVVGGVGGGLVATGGSNGGSAGSTGQLAVYPCPNQGPALATVAGGQQLLVTGRLADGTWYRVHLSTGGRSEGWIQASPVTVQGTVSTLPIATCAPERAVAAPSVEPFPSLTAIVNATPSPGPTASPTSSPTSGPTPTPNAHPKLTTLTASTSKISYDQGAYCPTAVKKVTFTVKASDATGLAAVTLYWRAPGAAAYTQTAMTLSGGTATSGTWQLTLDTTANSITKAGTLNFYAIGKDAAGATAKIPVSGSDSITVAVCVNTGPSITKAASSSGSSLYWDPLGVGTCQTATNITAVVSDPDGVKSVTLYFRRPGSSTWSSKAMDNTTIPGKWYANLDTLGDKISIPTPPTGTLSWYIKAVDSTGLASQTKTASLTIRRCDTEARFDVNSVGTFYTFCPPKTTSVNLAWSFSITDPDVLTSATLTYRIVNNTTGATYSQTKTVKVTAQPRFSISSAAIDGNGFYGSNSVYWTITTTDRYGGKSAAPATKNTVTISVC